MLANKIKSSLKNLGKELAEKKSFSRLLVRNTTSENISGESDSVLSSTVQYKSAQEEISDYIVENPNEIKVEFPLCKTLETPEPMPFFRAILYKLGKRELVNI